MAAVFLLLMAAVTGATGFSSMNFLSGMQQVDMPENSFACPLGQMYCFRTNRCVNRVDKSCPGIPNCPANQVVCNVGGNLECVDAGTCEKIDVKFKIQKSYDQVVGVNHGKITAFMDNIRQKFAVKLGRAASEFWGVEIHPGENAVWVTFNSVPDAEADLNNIFKNEKQQFLTDQDGLDLIIDFSQGGFISKDCGTGQICWQTEEAQCVPEYQCPTYFVEVTMAADYGSTVGMDDEGFNRNLVSQLSNGLNVPSEAIEYPSVHPGSIVFDFQTSLTDIQQRVQDLINNGHFPKDLSGNLLTVIGLTATLITGDANSGNGPGDWKFDWQMPFEGEDDYCVPGECTRCQPGEHFCFMSQMCIKEDGTCATNDKCETTEEPCWDQFTGEPYCMAIGMCTVAEMQVAFTLEGDCTAAEPENVFKDLLRTQLAAELQISESEINNVMFTCGPIVVTFEIQGGSPTALSAALHALEALVESGVPLQVGADTYPILPLSLRLGNCERDSDDHCMEQCPAPEVPCWDKVSGQSYCELEALCITTTMKVSFHMDGDIATVDLGTDVFKQSLKTSLAGLFGTIEDAIPSLEVSLSDDGSRLVVQFQVENTVPSELDGVLRNIKAIVEPGVSLNINGYDFEIVPDTLHFGNNADCPTDSSGNCVHMPDDCPDTEVPCWDNISGQSYCELEALCTTTTMKVSFHMDGDMATVDLGTDIFKQSLKTSLAGLFGTIEDAIPSLEVSLSDDGSRLVVQFQVENTVPSELDGVLRNIKAIVEPGVSLNINGYDFEIVPDTLHFGNNADCPTDSSGNCVHMPDDCPDTEVQCWLPDGTFYCEFEGSCTETTMPASLHLDGDTSSVDLGTDVFKTSLQTELASQLGISEVVLLNFEVSLSADNALEVNFLVESSSPAELNSILKSIKGIADGSQSLVVNGIEYWITAVHFGTSADCPKDGSGNCMPPPANCLVTEEGCWDPFTGEPYCVAAGMCTEVAIQATFTLEGDCTAIGSEDAFKDSLRAQLSIELQISESEITYLEVACGSIVVTFELHGGSSAALSAALVALKELVESEGPLQVGADAYPILPTSLRLGSCERDSEGHCLNMPAQCQAPEVPCWDDVSGQSYCEAETLCSTTMMKVSFHMAGDMATVDLGTDVFKLSLKTALAGLFGVTEDVIPYLEVFLSDDGSVLVVKLQVENTVLSELDDVLGNIKAVVEPGIQLNVNGFDYDIIPNTLHYGTNSDCPRDSSGNCVHAPDDCPATEVTCWYADGTPYCDSEGSCTVTTMPVFFRLAGDTTSVDLGTDSFKLLLQTTLAGQLGIDETLFLNFEVSLSGDGALDVYFDVESSSANNLDGILKGIKGIADGSQPLSVNGIEYWIIVLHFGTSTANHA